MGIRPARHDAPEAATSPTGVRPLPRAGATRARLDVEAVHLMDRATWRTLYLIGSGVRVADRWAQTARAWRPVPAAGASAVRRRRPPADGGSRL